MYAKQNKEKINEYKNNRYKTNIIFRLIHQTQNISWWSTMVYDGINRYYFKYLFQIKK